MDLNEGFIKSQGEFYYDINSQIIENKKNSLGKDYIVTSNFSDNNWQITDEIDTINNYVCKKATLTIKEPSLQNKEREHTATA